MSIDVGRNECDHQKSLNLIKDQYRNATRCRFCVWHPWISLDFLVELNLVAKCRQISQDFNLRPKITSLETIYWLCRAKIKFIGRFGTKYKSGGSFSVWNLLRLNNKFYFKGTYNSLFFRQNSNFEAQYAPILLISLFKLLLLLLTHWWLLK